MGDKKAFVKELAKYLTENQATKSILLEMGKPEAKQWAALRNASPVRGYPTVEKAEDVLTQWFGGWLLK